MRKQTLAGVPRTPSRPQCRESVHIQRFQIVPWSGSYSVPQLSFLGNVLWHFSWPQRWRLNTTTTIYSLLELTWFLSPRSGLVQSHSDFSIWLRNLTSSFRSSLTGLAMLTPLLTSDLEVPILCPSPDVTIPIWFCWVECYRKEGFFFPRRKYRQFLQFHGT